MFLTLFCSCLMRLVHINITCNILGCRSKYLNAQNRSAACVIQQMGHYAGITRNYQFSNWDGFCTVLQANLPCHASHRGTARGRGKQLWLERMLNAVKGLDREVCHAADFTPDFV